MREPAFWQARSSWQSLLLSPLGGLYGAITARRMTRAGQRVGVPVFCVGNYHVGGAGKTPTVLALGALLTELGERPWVVSRGYGGRLAGPVAVDPAQHTAADVGDEPLMLAASLPVIVARDRVAGAQLARTQGASVIVLDDGFQNPALAKDVALIVIDAGRGLGNGCVFPAGPLRAPLAPQLARTDALIVVGEGHAAETVASAVAARNKPVLSVRLKPDPASVSALVGKRVLAFAGIGDPRRFFATLRASGVDVANQRAFADHHPFSPSEIQALEQQAAREGLTLVTTEKDFVRLCSDSRLAVYASGIMPFKVSLDLGDGVALRTIVADVLKRRRVAAS
ncbi:tetraacyldisaccharide 4'-kinase [Bradyrhizobium prioriisuperbiae]|uniref:tetraacyldisaccharide 4'-kinase n=1 Tax=Bradyrhizobium prioriisuperbiae TaxID=2854389 RepID=UPI0028ECAD98|nr:tetraacyldisaccharide 4'-kinase [Bradyrhizobium prioritasuperba]